MRVHPGRGVSRLIKDHLAGGASRLAALLLPHIPPVCSVVAPCHPGAALRDLVLVHRGPATRRNALADIRRARPRRPGPTSVFVPRFAPRGGGAAPEPAARGRRARTVSSGTHRNRPGTPHL